jgi:hypothetical protein
MKRLRKILDDTRETQAAWRPDEPESHFEFMEHMYLQHSRVIDAEGDWNKILQKRAEELFEQEQAEFEEYDAQKRAEANEEKVRARQATREGSTADSTCVTKDEESGPRWTVQ